MNDFSEETENTVATYKRASKNENGGGIKEQAAELAKYASEHGFKCLPSFGERLKKARKAAGISQQGMADQMLISKRTIEKWETGERIPPAYVQRFVLKELVSFVPDEDLLVAQLKSGVFSDNEIKAGLFLKGKNIEEIDREIELAKQNLQERQ